jgi:hypothetical protein
MPFNPETDIHDMGVYVVSHGGKKFALFPYISALAPVPVFASICHQIASREITKEERCELAALIKQRGVNAGWLFDGVFAWLVTTVERDNVLRRQLKPQIDRLRAETRAAAPRRKPPKAAAKAPLRERQAPSRPPRTAGQAAAKSKIKSSRG